MSASAACFPNPSSTADLKPGGLIVVGCQSNFLEGKSLSWVYFAATLDAAI